MPASLDQLYSYDLAIETAWRDVLQDAFDSNPLEDYEIKVGMEQDDIGKATPFVDVQLSDVLGHDHKHLISGVPYYNVWQAHLISRVVSQRGTNSHLQATMIGMIRARAAVFQDLLTVEVLPYHTILMMKDVGLHRGLIKSEVLDFSEVIHLVKFGIREDAWPV